MSLTLMYGCWNIYVPTLKILFRLCSCAAFSICVATQFLFHDGISVGSCCNSVFCIVSILVVTRKACRDRVLSPFNLISCCKFIFMLRHSLLVFIDVLYHDLVFMSRQDFFPSAHLCVASHFCYVATRLLFLMFESLSRDRKVYCDLVYLCSSYFCVVTLISLSRHQNFSSTSSMLQH